MGECILQGGGGGAIPQLCEQIENFTIRRGNLSMILNWSAPTDDENESFVGTHIVRKVGSCPKSPRDGTVVYEGTALTYTDTGLTAGTTYYYRAFAYNSRRKYQNSLRLVHETAASVISIVDLPVGTLLSVPYTTRWTAETVSDFVIVHQGNPNPEKYSADCDGTWILCEKVATLEPYQETLANNKSYPSSTLNQYANGTFYDGIDADVKNYIKDVKLPVAYTREDEEPADYRLHVDNYATKVFILSPNEVGASDMLNIGSKLDYFESCNGDAAEPLRVAYYTGTNKKIWWLRSLDNSTSASGGINVPAISENGSKILRVYNELRTSAGFRPAMIMSPYYVNPTPNARGAYEISEVQ